jgi:two-component system, cell cycle sensor histidine kinase and response regulator CckA
VPVPVEDEAPGGTETILLVEDDPSVRKTTRRMLESKGYQVLEAACGGEALVVWHRYADETALVVTDMVMPEGMTGRDLAERLRHQRPELKVIFMSGYSADVLCKDPEFVRRNQHCFLQKPCSAQDLLGTVRRCLDEGLALEPANEAARSGWNP